ncbi:hypothetical protein [Novosphingobium panipatense]|uniref:hypothetical protein n=1 Tax=Novosphingobium panipatense TaxID=428991 RepID=UPI003608C659
MTDVVLYLETLEHELLLFAAFWIVIGALDELGLDLCWLSLRLLGRGAPAGSPKPRLAHL